jgi:hypothetical protein
MPLSRIGSNSITDASITTGDLANTLSISANTGSASAPAIFPTGDNNTGIFFPAADTIAFAEGGVESMRIDSAGIVTGTAGNLMLISGTAVASTSGTSIDFTGIPSWAKRVTVMLNGVSWNSTVSPLIRLGDSGGIETTGYNCISGGTSTGAGASGANITSGFNIFSGWNANELFYGSIVFSLFDISTNTWAAQGIFSVDTSSQDWGVFLSGTKSLSATLDRVRITSSGAVTFNAGTINILYE